MSCPKDIGYKPPEMKVEMQVKDEKEKKRKKLTMAQIFEGALRVKSAK